MEQLTMTVKDVNTLILLQRHVASNDKTRYYLNGLLLEKQGNKTFAVATDGYKMLKKRIDLPEIIFEKKNEVIVKFLDTKKFPGKKEDIATLDITDTSITITGDSGINRAVVIEDTEYPDYKRVIPEKNKNKIKLNTEFLDNIRKAFNSDNRDNAVIIDFSDSNSPCRVTIENDPDSIAVLMPIRM